MTVQKRKETIENKSQQEKDEINRRISETVKKRWMEGTYAKRNKDDQKH
jgi:hypothetical protein